MSQYKEITTQFTNIKSLLKALEECGLGNVCEVAPDTKVNSFEIVGYGGSRQQRKVAVRLPRSLTHGYEDTGFYYDPQTKKYNAVISTHDSNYGGRIDFGQGQLQKVTQRYAVNELKRLAPQKGYRVKETKLADGSYQLDMEAYR